MERHPICLTEIQAKKFLSKVLVSENDSCWEWQGYKKPASGYGVFCTTVANKKGSVPVLAHRIAYYLHHKIDPSELQVLHHCDNPKCCNPAHLFAGTDLDNKKDMVAKGRCAFGDKSGRRKHPEKYPCGEKHPASKVSAKQVIEIRNKFTNGNISKRKLGKIYGLHHKTIAYILSNKTWKNIV